MVILSAKEIQLELFPPPPPAAASTFEIPPSRGPPCSTLLYLALHRVSVGLSLTCGTAGLGPGGWGGSLILLIQLSFILFLLYGFYWLSSLHTEGRIFIGNPGQRKSCVGTHPRPVGCSGAPKHTSPMQSSGSGSLAPNGAQNIFSPVDDCPCLAHMTRVQIMLHGQLCQPLWNLKGVSPCPSPAQKEWLP